MCLTALFPSLHAPAGSTNSVAPMLLVSRTMHPGSRLFMLARTWMQRRPLRLVADPAAWSPLPRLSLRCHSPGLGLEQPEKLCVVSAPLGTDLHQP